MRFFADCFTLGNCYKQHQDDDEQIFADQLEQQSPSHSKVEQPQPQPQPQLVTPTEPELQLQLERTLSSTPEALLKPRQLQLELQRELELEPEQQQQQQQQQQLATPSAVVMRGSHSPARLEEINICADVHPSRLLTELAAPQSAQKGNAAGVERCSGVAIKDEIEIFTDVDLGNGAHYFAF
ncbi:hypothetical protein AWZ03_011194 [Drosophila navojoa]|uniref:Uncharacterized protein n=1 Tax=Drosophila navojoa TaxID=7232 RepID=A0A484B0J5_DRONA|nr:hypothetical protein AWZ03_011194 [Drosophila navojoa]